MYVYDIGNMHLLVTIDTCPNPNGNGNNYKNFFYDIFHSIKNAFINNKL